MLIVNDPLTDPFDGMADFVPDPEAAATIKRARELEWRFKAQRYEIALKQMQMALRSTPPKPKKPDLAKAMELALDVADSVLMGVE